MTMPRESTGLYSMNGFAVSDTTLYVYDDDTMSERIYEESFNIYRKDSDDCFCLDGYVMFTSFNHGFIRLYNDDITEEMVNTLLNMCALFDRNQFYNLTVTYFRKGTADLINMIVKSEKGDN